MGGQQPKHHQHATTPSTSRCRSESWVLMGLDIIICKKPFRNPDKAIPCKSRADVPPSYEKVVHCWIWSDDPTKKGVLRRTRLTSDGHCEYTKLLAFPLPLVLHKMANLSFATMLMAILAIGMATSGAYGEDLGYCEEMGGSSSAKWTT